MSNYIIHYAKGQESKNHKWIDKKWANGAWQYIYDRVGGQYKKKAEEARSQSDNLSGSIDRRHEQRQRAEAAKLRMKITESQRDKTRSVYGKANEELAERNRKLHDAQTRYGNAVNTRRRFENEINDLNNEKRNYRSLLENSPNNTTLEFIRNRSAVADEEIRKRENYLNSNNRSVERFANEIANDVKVGDEIRSRISGLFKRYRLDQARLDEASNNFKIESGKAMSDKSFDTLKNMKDKRDKEAAKYDKKYNHSLASLMDKAESWLRKKGVL